MSSDIEPNLHPTTSVPHFGRLYQKRFYADQAAFDAGTVSETITMTHDAFGRELTTVWDRVATTPGLVVDTWANTLDEHGRLNQVDSPTGQIFYEYDSQGRQVRVATRPAGFTPQNDDDVSTDIRYTYDLLGRLASVETWERNDVLVDTDPVTAGQQPETNSYVYDLVGNLDRELNPDGSTTDYTFDDLNRLTDITTTRSDGTLLTDFDYTLRADGKRDLAVEKIYSDDGSLASHTTFDWEYDAAGRLTDEVFTNANGLLFDLDDYHTAFEYDLTGNRISKSTITDDDGTPGFDAATDTDEVITYGQGANDRMTSEDRAVDGVAVDSTSYGHTGTQQTSKAVTPAGSLHSVSSVVYSYDLQGRMSQAVTTASDPSTGVATRIDTTSYRYGTDGIRISATQQLDTDADGTIDSIERTEYLIDARNHTGYQQVLEETVYDVDPVTGVETESKKIVYTIGHDHVSQTTFEPGGPAEGVTLVFQMDGHGSTRVLTDLAGSIAAAAAPQIFHFTAYGKAINFTMSEAATSYLYSGEQFDSRIGQQYLRARYYDAATGTFNRLDPFFGNQTDPQSFHKYLYTHGDPVNGTDPTGKFVVLSVVVAFGIGSHIRAKGMERNNLDV